MENKFNSNDEHSSVDRLYRFAPNGRKSAKIVYLGIAFYIGHYYNIKEFCFIFS